MADPLVRSVARSHVGVVRRHNEDSFLDRPDIGLWVVADGMGGMTAGDVASRLIVSTLDEIEEVKSPADLLQQVRRRVRGVNVELREMAAQRSVSGIGSTVAGLIVHSGYFACFWAGDSRVYRCRAGELDRLTRDHSLVQDMVDAGLLSPGDAERHPNAHIIQRAVGIEDDVAMECVHARVELGDRFLLCSDGLTRMVADPELEAQLAQSSIEQVCDTLMDMVLDRGAKDNVTIVLVEIS